MGILAKIKFNIRQIEKEVMQHIILPVSYRLAKGAVDENLVILADCHHDSCPEELRLIKHRLKKEGYDVKSVFFDIGRLSALGNLRKMTGFMRLYKNAGTVIICSYFLPVASCRKRKGTKVINVWHGCGAMKKFGHDAAEDIPKDYIGNPFKNTDIMCVSGDACVEPFTSAVSFKETAVLPMGISVTDVYFNDVFMEKSRERFEKLHPDARGKKVVLWAPTFRDNAAKASCFGEEYIDELMEDEKISSEYYIIKSVHPNSVKHMHTKYKAENADVTDATVNLKADDEGKKYEHLRYAIGHTRQLMMCSDILITDYSSVWFEYLLMDKPLIFFAPDYGEYLENRGLYMKYDEVPGVIIKDEKNSEKLKAVLKENAYDDDSLKAQRHTFKTRYMNGCDGNATDKLIEKIRER
jgi:CDP-ribitol ribitolphosphotransferase